MSTDNRNCIAFKLNFCNGGIDCGHIGFYGICSKAMIEHNINKEKRNWCSRSYCKDYLDRKITYDELKNYWSPVVNSIYHTCFESRTLRDWIVGAGADANGDLRKIKKIDDLFGKLCILTTVRPGYKEIDRVIFAMFIISDIQTDDDYCDEVIADKKYRIEFKANELDRAKYWEIKKLNKDGSKRWGSGLFRYFDNDEALQFLKMAVEIKTGTSEEKFAKEFLEYYCRINNIKK